jgi:splicing factor 1
LDEIY